MRRSHILFALCCALTLGCAEHNFVPGSPMAKAFGYSRTYEEIAAEDCEKQFGFSRAEPLHKRCVYELSISRRKSDDAYMAAMGSLASQAAARKQAPTTPASNQTHTYIVDGRTITCTTTASTTTCN
jgi:hypothetical protein